MRDYALAARCAVAPAATSWSDDVMAAAPGYAVGLCRDLSGLRQLGAEWNGLLDHAVQPSVFLKHQWMEAWWNHFAAALRGCEPFVLTARDADGRLVGLLPFYRQTMWLGPLRVRVLRFLGTAPESPEHLDAIVHRSHRAPVLDALMTALVGVREQFDVLELTDLADDAALLPVLSRLAHANGYAHRRWLWQQCPYVRTEGSFEGYLKQLSSKHRYKVRLFGRRLAEHHQVEVEVASDPAAVSRGMDALFRLHAMRWAHKSGISAFDDEAVHRFHRAVAVALAADDAIRLFLLRCDGRPVAACYCLLFDGRMAFFQPGFDPEFRSFHVGKVLLAKALESCFQTGVREFDFLRGQEDYKFDWTRDVRPTWACDVAVSPVGRVWYGLRHLRRRVQAPLTAWRQRAVARLRKSPSGARLLMVAKRLLDRPRNAADDD